MDLLSVRIVVRYTMKLIFHLSGVPTGLTWRIITGKADRLGSSARRVFFADLDRNLDFLGDQPVRRCTTDILQDSCDF